MADAAHVRFASSDGVELAGRLHLPEDAPRGGVVLVHCFTCGKDIATMTRLARGLADAGYAVLRIDLRGLGDSDGDFASATLTSDVRDVRAAVAELHGRDLGPVAVVGHSMGGAAALLAGATDTSIDGVAVLAAASDANHVRHLLPELEDTRSGEVEISVGGQRLMKAAGFLDDLDRHDLRGAAADLDRPLLVLHGTADDLVDIEHGEALHAMGGEQASLVRLEGADHLLTSREHARQAVDALTDWLGQLG